MRCSTKWCTASGIVADSECVTIPGLQRTTSCCAAPGKPLNPVAENIAAGDALDMAAEAEFQLGAVERRLLEFLLGVRERFDIEHHEGVARCVRCFQRWQVALDRIDAAKLEHALEAKSPRDGGVIVVGGIGQAGIRGRAINAIETRKCV